uniref:uncharacterized protein LOC120342289 n=1 Tax=Styela clava TaxID=7725 RepID=UPI001939A1D8|nr:uncharacterized protein LOC120342289 [Styela clava]
MKNRNMTKTLLLFLVLFGLEYFVDSKSIVSDDEAAAESDIEKRQHWSYGFAPGGKRSFPQIAERQHWSYGFAPGGRREEIPTDVEKRQHWSYGFAPGGKREFKDMPNMPELSEFEKRQHWSYGFAPGGKREFNDQKRTAWPVDIPLNAEEKRSVWNYGWAPNAEREIDPGYFIRQLLIAKSMME